MNLVELGIREAARPVFGTNHWVMFGDPLDVLLRSGHMNADKSTLPRCMMIFVLYLGIPSFVQARG